MRILYVMHIKTDPKLWRRLGDMKMACEMSMELGDRHEIDFVGDYSGLSDHEKSNLKDSLNAHDLIDMSEYASHPRYISKMFQHFRDNNLFDNYDIVHIHTSKMNIMSAIMKYCPQSKPIVVSFHSPPESREMMRFYRDDMLKFCKVPHYAFVCNSASHRQRCINVLNVPEEDLPSLTYAYNGVRDIYDLTPYAPGKRDYAGGTVSRINSLKSAYESLVFLSKLSEKTGKRCFFVGNIAEYERGASGQEYYQKCLPLLQDESKIHWIKSASPHDIGNLYQDTDVNVFFGRVETFGLPILEAGLTGVPAIVLDSNGAGEIVEEGKNGYKCKVDKPIKWKNIYEEGLALYDKCLTLDPKDIRDYTLDKFSVSKLGESINSIYRSIYRRESHE